MPLPVAGTSSPDVVQHCNLEPALCLQSYRKAVSTARRDKKGARAAGLTEEQKQEIRQVFCQHFLR